MASTRGERNKSRRVAREAERSVSRSCRQGPRCQPALVEQKCIEISEWLAQHIVGIMIMAAVYHGNHGGGGGMMMAHGQLFSQRAQRGSMNMASSPSLVCVCAPLTHGTRFQTHTQSCRLLNNPEPE
jgi:hypothetical protein